MDLDFARWLFEHLMWPIVILGIAALGLFLASRKMDSKPKKKNRINVAARENPFKPPHIEALGLEDEEQVEVPQKLVEDNSSNRFGKRKRNNPVDEVNTKKVNPVSPDKRIDQKILNSIDQAEVKLNVVVERDEKGKWQITRGKTTLKTPLASEPEEEKEETKRKPLDKRVPS